MKVKCIKIYNGYKKQFVNSSDWITIGKEYIVLEIDISIKQKGGEVSYRMLNDNPSNEPALFQAFQFELVSEKISSNWKVFQFKDDSILFRPAVWHRQGFWEDFYDGKRSAVNEYIREASVIVKEEGGDPGAMFKKLACIENHTIDLSRYHKPG